MGRSIPIADESGFTMVELVVVIMIIGVLGATAMSRMVNFQDGAREATVKGTAASLISGVSMAHMAWKVTGQSVAVDNISFGNGDVDTNVTGWPVTTTDGQNRIASHQDCVDLWDALMHNPPGVQPFAGGPEPKFGVQSDTIYQATRFNDFSCVYYYRRSTAYAMSISYNATAGTVIVDSDI